MLDANLLHERRGRNMQLQSNKQLKKYVNLRIKIVTNEVFNVTKLEAKVKDFMPFFSIHLLSYTLLFHEGVRFTKCYRKPFKVHPSVHESSD